MSQASSPEGNSQTSPSPLPLIDHIEATKTVTLSSDAPIECLPPELLRSILHDVHYESKKKDLTPLSIVLVCKTWYRCNIELFYKFVHITSPKSLQGIAWTTRNCPDLAKLIVTLVFTIQFKEYRDYQGELLTETLSNCPGVRNFVTNDVRWTYYSRFEREHPPRPLEPIGIHQRFFQSASLRAHNLVELGIHGHDISSDTILRIRGDSGSSDFPFPFPNLLSLTLDRVLMKRGHQFPLMPRISMLEIASPKFKKFKSSPNPDDAPKYSIHRGSFPSLFELTLKDVRLSVGFRSSKGPDASSLVSPDLMKDVHHLVFHVPSRLLIPLNEMDKLRELDLGVKYTSENGLPTDALPRDI
ncbi:hypothetical protein NLI96_g6813 [Meripilus lineatus]|uniref:F-box domain-containing protein n=1 Tax=Meripilus lineatus TaxID=2056292 RepID=A0AAD5V1Z8_9APHY|nr:hypothetical protein NLI96_g6813 [Physisporinus lineatus]